MPIYLKQSTASQEIPLGYFLDSTDGNTEETGLTIANTDIKIWKAGATTLANKNSGGATHIANGIYYCVLDATDTNTVGSLVIFVHVSGALSIRVECVVLPANVYDSLIAGSDYLQADAVQIEGGDATDQLDAHDGNPLDAAGIRTAVGLASANLDTQLAALPTAAENRAEMDSNSTQLAAIVADTNELQTDDVPGLIAALNDPTAAAIADAVWDEDIVAAHNTADTAGSLLDDLGTPANFKADVSALATSAEIGALNDLSAAEVNAEVDTALADYDGPTKAELDAGLGALNDPTAAAIADAVWDEDVVAAHNTADTAGSLLDDLGTPADFKADVSALATSAEIGALNDLDAAGIRTAVGLASANLDTQLDALPTAAENRAEMDSNSTQLAAIVADTNELQTDDVPGLIAALNDPTAAAIADAVWDEDIVAAHNTADTAGSLLDDLGTPADFKADVSALATSAEIGALNDLDAAGVRAAVGLASANLDTQLDALPTAAEVRAEIDSNSTQLAAIVADTNELQTDDVPGLIAALNDPSAAAIADAVWDETLSEHLGAGSTGNALNAAGAAGDPWSTSIPGAYGAGTAGYILGNNLDGAISDIPTAAEINAEVDTALADYDGPTKAELDAGLGALNDPTAAAIADAVWDEDIVAAHNTADSAGSLLDDLGTPANFKADVSALATSAEIGALNDLSAAEVNAEVDTALADYDGPTKAELDAGLAGLNDLDAAGVRAAVGMASANLDTQLAALPTATENATQILSSASSSPIAANVKKVNDVTLTGDGETTPIGAA